MKSPFRSIRQKLFHEGKLLRYLGYAIGEILLIIVGILMALQINDWNEDRKRAAQEGTYLTALHEDIVDTIERNDIQKSGTIRMADRLGVVVSCLQAKRIAESDQNDFANGLYMAGKFASVPLMRNTIDELVSTGYLATIRNEAIKDQLNVVLEQYEYLSGHRPAIFDRSGTPQQYIDRQVVYKFEKPTSGVKAIAWEQLEIDFEALCRDKQFYHAVSTIRSLAYDVADKCLAYGEELETLRNLLEAELEAQGKEGS